jgi:hypothetical protein
MLLLTNPVIISLVKPLCNASTGLTKVCEFDANLFSNVHAIPWLNVRPIQAGHSEIFSQGSRVHGMPFLPKRFNQLERKDTDSTIRSTMQHLIAMPITA